MLSFIIRRLLIAIPLVLLSTVLEFLLVANSGDPMADLKGRNPPVPPQVIQTREHQLGLDKPMPQRYWTWLTHFVRGDMGKSIHGVEVRPLLWQRMRVTLRMVVLASILAIVLAIGAGVLSAVKQYTVTDYTFTFTGFLFLSMPVFWLAALLKEYGAIRLNKLFCKQAVSTVGAETPNLTGSLGHRLADYAGHLALPTIALALISFAAWSRYQRATMLDVLGSDYIRLARAKGLSRTRVMVRHALRNALIPLVTVVAIDTGAIFGGAIITERVFSWQGMGALLVQGAQTSDPNILLAWLTVTAVIVVLFNLIADLLYAVLDPRIRYGLHASPSTGRGRSGRRGRGSGATADRARRPGPRGGHDQRGAGVHHRRPHPDADDRAPVPRPQAGRRQPGGVPHHGGRLAHRRPLLEVRLRRHHRPVLLLTLLGPPDGHRRHRPRLHGPDPARGAEVGPGRADGGVFGDHLRRHRRGARRLLPPLGRLGADALHRPRADHPPHRDPGGAGRQRAPAGRQLVLRRPGARDRKSTRLNSSHVEISYAVFCLKKKKKTYTQKSLKKTKKKKKNKK